MPENGNCVTPGSPGYNMRRCTLNPPRTVALYYTTGVVIDVLSTSN